MRTRVSAVGAAALAAAGVAVFLVPAAGQQIHRHGFAGRGAVLVRGDSNVRAEEKEHDLSTQSFKSQPSSEHLKLVCDAGTGDAAFIHYLYDTPPAPVTDLLSASVWVKATKPGVQLRARVVFPKEPNPARPEEPLTSLIVGDTYSKTQSWQKLSLGNVPEVLGKHLPALQLKTGRAVNTADAYVDKLVLNVYTGPGPVDVWVDDVDVGPVRQPAAGAPAAQPVSRPAPRPGEPALPVLKARVVKQEGGQLSVDNKPYFFRAVRHTGTPLFALREAGFNTLWVPADASQAVVDDAVREGMMLVPTAPLAGERADSALVGVDRDAEAIATYLKRFLATDSVLFWDLGAGRTAEQVDQVGRTAEVIQRSDPRRPKGVDLWDGFEAYSATSVDVIGAHRWPLFTSLELTAYRDWLAQRRLLTGGTRNVFWTWVQNHLPDWYVSLVAGRPDADQFDDPVGPQPEQVRLLAYLSIAAGARGLGFWSDRFLATTHHGRDRLLGMALLNAELDMLGPVLMSCKEPRPQWLDTNHPYVKAAVLRGERGTIVLPIWLGPGSQCVPDQGALPALTVTVPLVPEGADPWHLHPAGVRCLRDTTRRVPGGTELTIPQFDLVAPVVFTNDQTPNGLVVWWQDYTRRYGKQAAQWSLDLAAEQYQKVLAVHNKLLDQGATVRDADVLFRESARFYREAQKHYAADLYDKAAAYAGWALRPLRVVMREHWHQATATLDLPTASPYAGSYYTLPQHWELAKQVRASRPGGNVLTGGTFELNDVPPTGARVESLPGWTARAGTLDKVNVAAAVIPSNGLNDAARPRQQPEPAKTMFRPSRAIVAADEGYTPPQPEFGKSCLKLEVRRRVELTADGKPRPPSPVLERTFLAVDSPVVKLPPGTLVRVSAWVKVPQPIQGTADGVLVYDDAAGEPLGVRTLVTTGEVANAGGVWKHYHLYRRVPSTGQISVTLALTGVGTAFFEDVRIEPLVGGDAPPPPGRPRPTPDNVVGRPPAGTPVSLPKR